MLKQASAYLKGNGINNFIAVNASASDLPFKDNIVDCVFTFNAVHHFNLAGFLEEAARLVPSDATILEHLGDAYLKVNDLKMCLESYTKALENKEKDKAALEEKIESVQEQLGQHE